MTPLTITTEFRVRYAETDAMAVAHHSHYAVWFEMGRTDFMHALGLPYAEIEARGYYLMLSGLNVQFKRAARYDDQLTLTTTLSELRSRAVTFEYLLERRADSNERIATGQSQHITTDKNYRPCRLPEDVFKALALATPPQEQEQP